MLEQSERNNQHNQSTLPLNKFLEEKELNRSLVQIPLEFIYQPVEIISKEFTKFNNSYEFRVVYLGPRWATNHVVHRNLARNLDSQNVTNPEVFGLEQLKKYQVNFGSKQKYHLMKVGKYDLSQKSFMYYRAFEGSNPTIKAQQQLKFDGHFESGNLDCVIKISNNQYDLFIRIDSNTRGHVLWYYFSISNRQKQRIKLNICNIMKHTNLYKKNMKPYIFSTNKFKRSNVNWQQGCDNIKFQEKQLRYQFVYEKIKVRQLSQLSFEYEFEYQNDTVFFAYCVPYTYSFLLYQIEKFKEETKKENILQIETLGYSLLGISIPLLKITNPFVSLKQKKIVLVTGRIHPGQTCGSLMVSGLIRYLCSNEASQLIKQCIFLIIPMMNPDGVILGNYRTGISGVDLNRTFRMINKEVYPQVYYFKMFIKKLSLQHSIYLYFDFHGHSSKKNAFTFGPQYKISDTQYYRSKLLPKLVSLKTPMFRYYSCTFKISESKKDTARSIMFYQFDIPYTFTVEASNGSFYDQDKMQIINFNKRRWEQIGQSFGPAIFEFVQLIVCVDRKQNNVIQTALGTSRKNNTSKRVISQQVFQIQHSVELIGKPSLKKKYQVLIQQIKNEQKKHKKQQSDSQVSSDDNNILDDLPKIKLIKLSQSIHDNYVNTVNNQCSSSLSPLKLHYIQSSKKIDFGINRQFHFKSKNQKINSKQKSEIDSKQIIKKMFSTRLVHSKDKYNNTVHSRSITNKQYQLQQQKDQKQFKSDKQYKEHRATSTDWKRKTQFFQRTHTKRNVSAGCTSRSFVPKVQMSLQINDKKDKQEEEFRRYMQLFNNKYKNRTRSVSNTQKGKRKIQQPIESFLYPQVFQFQQYVEQNQRKISRMIKQKESKLKKHLYSEYKPSCPSAFYKIKQSLNSKKKESFESDLEKGMLLMNITKKQRHY